ncbi:HXXEE domain-containing protein [Mycolicibacterium septicum]|uniref:HXXEE domain-containing protein n=1 Tax=Mycolicibacterium septicum TaxID=98668 RepID=UPI002361A154|nr:HXXEE domain-containing protein [Mycolicibacterium septicum]
MLKAWLPGLALAGLIAVVYLLARWPAMQTTHILSFAVAITLVAHIHEEDRFPGGFAYMFNVIRARSEVPDRYPMSPLIAMVVDVSIFVVLFLPALFLPAIIWVGMAPMFLALMEFLMHTGMGILQRRRHGFSIYNPGLATAIVFAIIAISYIAVTSRGNLIGGIEWLWAAGYFVATLLIFLVLPEFGLRSKTTRWGFDHRHFLGYYKRYTTVEEVFGAGGTATAVGDSR